MTHMNRSQMYTEMFWNEIALSGSNLSHNRLLMMFYAFRAVFQNSRVKSYRYELKVNTIVFESPHIFRQPKWKKKGEYFWFASSCTKVSLLLSQFKTTAPKRKHLSTGLLLLWIPNGKFSSRFNCIALKSFCSHVHCIHNNVTIYNPVYSLASV